MLILFANRSDENTVRALNSLDIVIPCSKQNRWHTETIVAHDSQKRLET